MKSRPIHFFLIAILICSTNCGPGLDEGGNGKDASIDSAAGDTDTDTDSDSDDDDGGTMDTDIDADDAGDLDGSSDLDTDTDTDTDTDSDTDTDTDSDTDGDSDADGDGDAGWITNVELDECEEHDADPNPSCIRYVDVGSTAISADGHSWPSAFKTVQEGIDSAADADGGCQVWVTAGTYFIFNDHWENTVQLKPEVYVYGGFTGIESVRTDRDCKTQHSILSGYDDAGINQVFHVVTGSDESILDGFIVTGGNAVGNPPHNYGGGIFNMSASPTVRNCIFRGNHSGNEEDKGGGGMYNNSNVLDVSNCIFFNNTNSGMSNADATGTIRDIIFLKNTESGLFNDEDTELTIEDSMFLANETEHCGAGAFNSVMESEKILHFRNCIFAGNISESGAAMCSSESNAPLVEDSIFSGNFAIDGNGGAIDNNDGAVTASRSIFAGNWASHNAGAHYIPISLEHSQMTLANNIYIGNTAHGYGGAIFLNARTLNIINSTFYGNRSYENGGGVYFENFSTVNLHNVIMWDNSPESYYNSSSTINSSHSDIEGGGFSGNGNIETNPLFVSISEMAGTWTHVSYDSGTYQTHLQDVTKSWTDSAYETMFVKTEVGNIPSSSFDSKEELSLYIADSNSNTIMIWGDFRKYIKTGYAYSIVDLELGKNSPCIDTADDNTAPEKDLKGRERIDVPDAGCDGTVSDMGAYEFSD